MDSLKSTMKMKNNELCLISSQCASSIILTPLESVTNHLNAKFIESYFVIYSQTLQFFIVRLVNKFHDRYFIFANIFFLILNIL